MRLGFFAYHVHRRGGMERAAAEVLARVGRAHDVTVVAIDCASCGTELRWRPVRVPSRPALYSQWAFRQRTAKSVRDPDFDLTVSVGAAAGEADVLIAQFCFAAFTARCGTARGGGHPLRRRYHAALQRYATQCERRAFRSPRLRCVIAVSQGVARELTEHYGVDAAIVHVIPNGVDREQFRPAADAEEKRAAREALGLPPAALLALFVGGDWERKGVGDAIAAVAGLEGVALAVVGRGDRDAYTALAAAHGAGSQVRIFPPSATPERFYAAADVFVFPSRYEAFSLVTLEAAAAGLPLLVRRINGTEELVTHGENGFFLSDDPDDLRTRLTQLRDDGELRRRMSAAARESSAPYTWERVATEQLAVFEAARALSAPR